MRYVLSLYAYDRKDPEVATAPDPAIVGRATELYELGERVVAPRPPSLQAEFLG